MVITADKPTDQAPLRSGFTTGSCATAASVAAYTGLVSGITPEVVRIVLPKNREVDFTIVRYQTTNEFAEATVIKDAGDDPDVTDKAEITARIYPLPEGKSGIFFKAGEGVGTVTKPGLPIEVGEAAINPVPRKMMRDNIEAVADSLATKTDILIEISIKNGAKIAIKTMNPRLGIKGGLSILGTTGIVIPYSCSAWIHSIHQGIDVARATGQQHIAICTGSTSEAALEPLFDTENIIDIGGFAGGFYKYFKKHPVPKITFAAGIGKLVKVAQGESILHGNKSRINFQWLAHLMNDLGDYPQEVAHCKNANTALEVITHSAHTGIIDAICAQAHRVLQRELGEDIEITVLAVNRQSQIIGHG